MAFQLAKAFVQFESKGVSGVNTAVDSIGQKLSGLSGYAITAGAAIAGLAGVSGIAGLGKLAADAETLSVRLEVLTQDAIAAKKIVADLQKFGATTPFDFKGLAATTNRLLAYGVAQQQILPTLRVLGDVASATGTDLNELAGIYGKMKGAGKLTAETLEQLTDRAVPMVGELAKQFGVAESEVRKLVSEGQVGFGDVQKVLLKLTQEGGQFYGATAKLGDTLAGRFGALADSVEMGFTRVGQAIVEKLNLKSIVENASSLVDMIADSVVPAVAASLDWLHEKIVQLAPTWQFIADIAYMAFSVITTMIVPVVKGIIDWAIASQQVFLTIGKVTIGVLALVKGIAALKIAAIAGFAVLKAGFLALMTPIGAVILVVSTLGIIFQDMFGAITSYLYDLVAHWDIAWPLMWEKIKLFVANSWERIKTWAINIVEIVFWVGRNIPNIFRDAAMAAWAIFSNLGENMRRLWTSLTSFFSGKGWNFNWKPLLDGFKSTVEQFPKLTQAQIQKSNTEIDRLEKALAARKRKTDATGADAEGEATTSTGGTAFEIAKNTMTGTAGKSNKASGKPSVESFGIAQFAEAMQRQASEQDAKKRESALAERQAEATERLADKAEGDGIKVNVVQVAAGGLGAAFGI